MLYNASHLNGFDISARDGLLGKVSDFLFDDGNWRLRWLVVDTGSWLSGRKVLLPVSVLGHIDEVGKKFSVLLTKKQVENSPGIDFDQPISRQMEANIFDYYGWNPYWGGSGYYLGGFSYDGGAMAASPMLEPGPHDAALFAEQGDPRLRSMTSVTSYHIHARDGDIGHVADFLIEDGDWTLHYLVVDTTNWWGGKKVLISPRSVRSIDWAEKLVSLSVDRQQVKDSPAYDENILIDRSYEHQFHRHYSDLRHDRHP